MYPLMVFKFRVSQLSIGALTLSSQVIWLWG